MKRHTCANLRVKSLRVKARVKIYTRVFCVDFSWKSAILHAMYPRVSAAMPVACTVWPAESSFFLNGCSFFNAVSTLWKLYREEWWM